MKTTRSTSARLSILFVPILSFILLASAVSSVHAADAGLILHLNLDEGLGTTAADSSGNGNDASLTISSWDVSGKTGSAIEIGPSLEPLVGRYATTTRLDLVDFTLSTWVKTTSDLRGDLILQYDGPAASYHGFGLVLNPGFISLGCGTGDLIGLWVGSTYICTPSPVDALNDGQWHLVTAVWDNTSKVGRIYFDGAQVAEETRLLADTSSIINTMYFGYNPHGGQVTYTGSLDDVRIYDRVLSSSEVQDLFTPPVIIPPTPNTSPTISLNGTSPVTLTVGDMFVDLGVTVDDAEDTLAALVVSSTTDPVGGVNTSIAGTYIVIYTVTDTDGAQASTTRTVIVNAPTPVVPPIEPPVIPPADPVPSVPVPKSSVSYGSGGSRSNILGIFGISTNSSGQVLGATAPCGKYLTRELRPLQDNDTDDIIRLQALINETTGANLPLTGVFGLRTLGAFKEFQLKYRSTIIDPWVANGSIKNGRATGLVGTTTLWTINNMICPSLQLPKPTLN